jgi:prophage regulatory protein
MGTKKEKTPTPPCDVLSDAQDAPSEEGLRRFHGLAPSLPLLFKRTVRRPELRKIVPLANTTIYEMEQRGEFPRRFFLTSRCVVWDLAEVEAWIAERRRVSDAASIRRAPTPDVRKRKTRPVRQ